MNDRWRWLLIDDAVDEWHESGPEEKRELYEFLGWTQEEYKAFVERGETPAEREGAM